MTSLLHPGVYVQEIPSGSRSIEGAPTSTTIFVGETERGPIGPTRIRGKSEYERLFGGYRRDRGGTPEPLLMPHSIAGFFDNGGGQAYVLRAMNGYDTATAAARNAPNPDELTVTAASPGTWGQAISVAYADSSDGNPDHFRIAVFYLAPGSSSPDPELVEDWDRLSIDPGEESHVLDVLRRSSFIRGAVSAPPLASRPATDGGLGPNPTEAELRTAAVASGTLTGGSGGDGDLGATDYADLLSERLAEVNDAALIVAATDRMMPGHTTTFSAADYVSHGNVFIGYVLGRPLQDLFFVGDLPRAAGVTSPVDEAIARAASSQASNYNALYWPHVEVPDPIGAGVNPTVVIPPSGHVAGLYARIDGRRGVWKAPAGVDALLLGGVRALDFRVLDTHQDNLNPLGINALRQIPAAGLTVWGARTRQPSSEWRYVPVRRTAIFLRKSIYEGIQWAVFEPNGDELWASLRATVGAFMETQFRNGAFFGSTSREAYFVKCDAETTPEIDRAAGIVNILVGFAPLRPAEFVVVKLSQKVNQTA